MNYKLATCSMLIVAMMLVVSIGTPVLAEPEPVEEEPLPEYGLLIEISLATLVGIAALSGFIGLVTGALLASAPESPSGNEEEIYKMAREMYAGARIDSFNTAEALISGIMPSDTTLWAHTTNYWERSAELISSAIWSNGAEYNPDRVYDLSLMRENVESYLYNWQSAIDKVYNNNLDARQYFTGDCFEDLVYSLEWTGGSISSTSDLNAPFQFDLTQIVRNATSGTYVWIDCTGEDLGGTYAQTSNTLYNMGSSTLKLTRVAVHSSDVAGATITVPAKSSLVLSSYEDGLYRIDTSGATFAGPLTESASDKSATIEGCLVFKSDNDVVYAVQNNNNVTVYDQNGSKYDSQDLKIKLSFTGQTTSSVVSPICDGDKVNIIRDWNQLIEMINTVREKARDAGETIWGIFDAAEASNSFISPSSITMAVDNSSLSVQQRQSIYIQAMMKIADYWETNGDTLSEVEFITNLESQDLIVYGDIYYNDTLWMEDVIFTPYLTVSAEQSLVVGQTTDWKGPGFAMIWDQQSDFNLWDGTTKAGSQALVDLNSSYSIKVDKILKNNSQISSITLKPTVIQKYTPDPTPPTPTPVIPKILDASMMMTIIMIELAVILFLLGYIFGQPMAGVILALIVLMIGVLFSDTIVSVILGTFSWKDLLPI